jgi:hypothetical protein
MIVQRIWDTICLAPKPFHRPDLNDAGNTFRRLVTNQKKHLPTTVMAKLGDALAGAFGFADQLCRDQLMHVGILRIHDLKVLVYYFCDAVDEQGNPVRVSAKREQKCFDFSFFVL